jgi:hypothetical protein
MNYLAIKKYLTDLGDNSEFILQDDGNGVFIKEWNSPHPQPTATELATIDAILNAEKLAIQYQVDRINEYPAIGDQLDALWKGGVDADSMKATVDAVKLKYPKP